MPSRTAASSSVIMNIRFLKCPAIDRRAGHSENAPLSLQGSYSKDYIVLNNVTVYPSTWFLNKRTDTFPISRPATHSMPVIFLKESKKRAVSTACSFYLLHSDPVNCLELSRTVGVVNPM